MYEWKEARDNEKLTWIYFKTVSSDLLSAWPRYSVATMRRMANIIPTVFTNMIQSNNGLFFRSHSSALTSPYMDNVTLTPSERL